MTKRVVRVQPITVVERPGSVERIMSEPALPDDQQEAACRGLERGGWQDYGPDDEAPPYNRLVKALGPNAPWRWYLAQVEDAPLPWRPLLPPDKP